MIHAPEMRFDAAPQARPSFKERVLWALFMGLFFFVIYGGTNQIGALTAPHPSFLWQWERHLPFVAELIVPYMSSDIVFVIAFLMAPTRDSLQRLALRSGLAIVISAAFFLALPLEFSFQRPEVTGWPAFLFDLLSVDKPYNQFPSLHVSLGIIAWSAITGRMSGVAKLLTTVWFLLILSSTVFVYQHHVIDLFGGAGVAVLVFWLVPKNGRAKVPVNFVSPRHLRVAFRYLIAATVSVVIAFLTFPAMLPVTVLCGWIACSLLLVCGCYVLGVTGFLRKTRRGYAPLTWLLYWPYLLGSNLNWRYWRGKVPLMARVASGVWIGVRPSRRDWEEIGRKPIESIVDLVPELGSAPPPAMSYAHFPLLDVVIPDPATLDTIARTIDDRAANGGVFVHCALGMSRSVLAACAWLMRNGHTAREALEVIDRARPERVTRPYVAIALDLYEDYLGRSPGVSGPRHPANR